MTRAFVRGLCMLLRTARHQMSKLFDSWHLSSCVLSYLLASPRWLQEKS